MAKFNDEQIERGRKLNRLLSHPDFEPLLEEWKDRIETANDQRLSWQPLLGSEVLASVEMERRALQGLRDWIDEEIESGANELRRKQEADQKVTADG